MKNFISKVIKILDNAFDNFVPRSSFDFYKIKGINYKKYEWAIPQKNVLGQLAIVLHAHLPYVRKMKKLLRRGLVISGDFGMLYTTTSINRIFQK